MRPPKTDRETHDDRHALLLFQGGSVRWGPSDSSRRKRVLETTAAAASDVKHLLGPSTM